MQGVLRRTAVLLCVGLGLAAHAAAPDAGVREPFRWDIPGGLERIEVPGEQHAMGIPMKLHAVRSSRSLQELHAHFLQAFARAGLYVPPPGDVKLPLSDPSLTALDPEKEVSYTIIFQSNPDGTVTCVLGEAHLGRRKPPGDFFAPLHPGARAPIQTAGEGMRTLNYETPAPLAEVLAFYRQTLTRQGFKEVDPLTFRKGQTLWKVQAQRGEGITRVLVVDSAQLPTTELQRVE